VKEIPGERGGESRKGHEENLSRWKKKDKSSYFPARGKTSWPPTGRERAPVNGKRANLGKIFLFPSQKKGEGMKC